MNRHFNLWSTCCRRFHFLLILILAGTTSYVDAARPFKIKVATLAPKGTIYHQVLQEMGEKWRAAQGGDTKFIIYTDGTQGTEAASVQRMRIGQLQASMLTVTGLKEIDESVTALQLMPMVFRSWDELDYVREGIAPELEQRFHERGFHILFWAEAGWVQFFSDVPRLMPEDYKSAHIFTWAGTNAQVTIMKSLDYRPVVLELSDIVPAVQTGMIDVVPVAPTWALAGQFYRNTPHMLKMNWVPIVGAAVITNKAWNAMRPEARQALTEAAIVAGQKLRDHRNTIDDAAIDVMKKRGLVVHNPTPEIEAAWQNFIKPVWPVIRGSLVPAATFDKVQSLLAEYRGMQQ